MCVWVGGCHLNSKRGGLTEFASCRFPGVIVPTHLVTYIYIEMRERNICGFLKAVSGWSPPQGGLLHRSGVALGGAFWVVCSW